MAMHTIEMRTNPILTRDLGITYIFKQPFKIPLGNHSDLDHKATNFEASSPLHPRAHQ